MRPNRRGIVGLLALGLVLIAACGKSEHPPAYRADSKSKPVDAGFPIPIDDYDASVPPPPQDLSNFCGNLVLPLSTSRPNLYIVLDRSGSMRDPMPDAASGDTIKKYTGALRAIHSVLSAMGHRVAWGAAVFPRMGNISTCDPGDEVQAVAPGDSVTYARNGIDGPHLTQLMHTLNLYLPEGATPTSATLGKVVERLSGLDGETFVLLATDGAPNCNEDAVCDIAHCTANIESALLPNGSACDASINCCSATAYYGPLNCIDDDASIAQLIELSNRNIKTYVIGLPGSEAYQTVLNRFAAAGGTARVQASASDPSYYAVTDTAELTDAMMRITASISISCSIKLDQVPPDWSQVNVYFDNQLVKMNPESGWKQVDAQMLEVTGDYCSYLREGSVFEVQVVAGCPTSVLL
jgi:hypothetical protein